jgi:hypothetical protein
MPIEQSFLGDFSGGEISAISSIEPQQGQWLLLEGFVLDDNKRLRAQWSGQTWIVRTEESS